jgi:hypothetical protein
MIQKYIFILILGTLLFACKDGGKSINQSAAINNVKNVDNLLPLPDSVRKVLFDQCTSIDYIFKSGGMSISFTRETGLLQTLDFANRNFPIKMRTYECAPIARKTFVIQMDIYLEAELFLDKNCQYYLFYRNGKPVYLAGISQDGLNFYSGVFKSVPKFK